MAESAVDSVENPLSPVSDRTHTHTVGGIRSTHSGVHFIPRVLAFKLVERNPSSFPSVAFRAFFSQRFSLTVGFAGTEDWARFIVREVRVRCVGT